MKIEQTELPPGWVWTTMEEIADVVGGGTPKTNDPNNYEGGTIPWITPADLSGYTAKHIAHGARFITQKGLNDSSAKMMPAGTVLFTSRAPIGYVAIASNPVCTNQGFKSFVLKEGALPDYVYWWLKGSKDLAESMASGTTFLELSGAKAKQIPIPVAPLDQQKRIVAEIEKQFSRLDEAIANLKRVKANLKRYKAAVLKAAVEGHLVETEAERARREGRSYETGAQLLQRILETRRSRWKGKGKYKEPAAPATTDLPKLPEGWVWATIDQSLMSLRNGLSKKPEDSEPGMPILRISAVRPLELDIKDRRFYRPQENEHVDDCKLQVGDLLFVRYNGTKELVGVCALVNTVSGALLYPDKLIRGRVVSEQQVLPSYLAISANVGKSRQHIDELIKTTAGQQGIAGGEIKKMPLPLPPYAEQLRIVVEIDRRLSLIRETEVQVDANFRRAERLRQSILSCAFSGKLHQITSAVSEMEMHTHG